MRTISVSIITILLFVSCRKSFFYNIPIDKNMKYYDKNFVLKNDNLKTNGFYYNIKYDEFGVESCSLYRFYTTGKLNSENTVATFFLVDDKFIQFSDMKGCYKFNIDTLVFTKDAHYFKKVKEYKGYFKNDTLFLTDIKLNKYEPYLFIEDGKTLNTGVDPKRYPME